MAVDKKQKKEKRSGSVDSAAKPKKEKKEKKERSSSTGSVKTKKEKKEKVVEETAASAEQKAEKKSKKDKSKRASSASSDKSKAKKDKKSKKERSSSTGSASEEAHVATAGTGKHVASEGDTVPTGGFGPYENKDRHEPIRKGKVRLGGTACRHDGGRQEIGSAPFNSRAEEYKKKWMTAKEKRADGRARCAADVKKQLEVVMKAATAGLGMCKSAIADEFSGKAQEGADKFKGLVEDDAMYQEEVRYKHMKLMDCLDMTREFEPAALQRDLVRNREIKARVNTLISGPSGTGEDAPFEVNEDEMDELVRVRNTLKTWYGGQNAMKGITYDPMSATAGKALSTMKPSEVVTAPQAKVEQEVDAIKKM